MTTIPQVRPDDVAAARKLLRGIVSPTPMLHSRVLSDRLSGPVFLKCENLQRTGSFKARGAYVRISRLTEAERGRGVVAASAGNHAQGVAFAAAVLGARATVVMPEGAPLPKVEATKGYGAEVILQGETIDDALGVALAYAQERGSVFIHPFDHPDVVAGQGTVGLEIMEQCPEARTIVVPVGGGGLASGIAVATSDAGPPVRVVGVQAEAVAPLPASLAAGHPVRIEPGATMADGIAVAKPGEICCDVFGELGVTVVTVTEETLSQGLLLCLERAKQLVEPAGRRRGGRHAGAPGGDRDSGRRGAVRRQHRSAAAGQGAAARPGRGRALSDLPLPAARPPRCARHAARRGGRARRERARRLA